MTVPVDLGERSYKILVGRGLLPRLGGLIAGPKTGRTPLHAGVFLVEDSGVPAVIRDRVARALGASGGKNPGIRVALNPSEDAKSPETFAAILAAATEARLERAAVFVALGGGIVGDLTGFAAASYRRGVPFVQCPTTLLAMVDASVGGKTGVNIRVDGSLRKNMAGAFHQPRLVVADLDVLASLPPREFRAGLAEMIKHGCLAGGLGDPTLFDATIAMLRRGASAKSPGLATLIARNIALKARVVESDEFETAPNAAGGRALLNLGHTFGHAIESYPALRLPGQRRPAPVMHGEAVALGLIAASVCAFLMGLCSNEVPRRVEEAVRLAGLPTRVRGLPAAADVLRRMGDDKKVRGGTLRLVLPAGDAPGRAVVVENPPPSAVLVAIDAIRAESNPES